MLQYTKRKSLWALLLAAALLVTACGSPAVSESPGEEMSDLGEPVAYVNGEPIYDAQYQKVMERMIWSYEQRGMDFSGEEGDELREQVAESVLDHLIQEAVLLQEAKKRNLNISNEEVEEKLESLKRQFDTEEAFLQILERTMFTVAELKDALRTEMTIEALLGTAVAGIEVEEVEIRGMYAFYEAQHQAQIQMTKESGEFMTEEELAAMALPPYEDIRDQLRTQLLQEKQQTVMTQFVDELMKSSVIEKLI